MPALSYQTKCLGFMSWSDYFLLCGQEICFLILLIQEFSLITIFFSKWQIIETDYFFEGHTPNHFLFRKNQDKKFLKKTNKKTIPSGSPMKIKCFVPNRIRHTLKLNTERCKTKTKKSRSFLSCPLTCLMKM